MLTHTHAQFVSAGTDHIYPIAVMATITGFVSPATKTALQATAAAIVGVLAYRGIRPKL
jgi:hypothetical protein